MLSDSVVVVTGGGHGIGEAVAIELGSYGASVVVNDLGTSPEGEGQSAEPAEETVEAIRDGGGTATAHFGDVSELDYAESLVEDTLAEYGRIDGIANFAGVIRNRPIEEMTRDDWDLVIDVHLGGHFCLLKAVASHWIEQSDDSDSNRSFIGVTSGAALGGLHEMNYSAAKAGVLGLVRSASDELALHGIRVNALSPGAKSRQNSYFPGDNPEENPPPDPSHLGPVVAFLLSDRSAGVNGCTVKASGEMIGVASDPTTQRAMFREDGWTPEAVADRFYETLGEDFDLDRSG
jgi:3-oxoacyl-[acyl-carrier protein] reductase